jgi:hypothetical protein
MTPDELLLNVAITFVYITIENDVRSKNQKRKRQYAENGFPVPSLLPALKEFPLILKPL